MKNNMISIIICTKGSDISDELKQNIAQTIGMEYELVVVDNSRGEYSIFSAYNEGIRRSKGDLLCFMHDDVTYKMERWGERVVKHFQQREKLGIVGMAGSHFLSSSPMYWYESPLISEHNLTNDHGEILECFKDDFYSEDGLAEVVACDGLCMFMRRSLFDEITFDTKTYSGFHMYDMDICMQAIAKGYKVCVCNDILVEHRWSERDMGSKKGMDLFYVNLELFSHKWQSMLPMVKGVDFLPEYAIARLDRMVAKGLEAKQVRKSQSYRIGAMILKPVKKIRQIFK